MDNSPQYSEAELIRFGLSTIFKMLFAFLVFIIVSSVFVIILGWFLSLAFPQFTHFQATIIPLIIIGFSALLMGGLSVWARLGDLIDLFRNIVLVDGEDYEDDEEEYDEYD